MIENEQQYQVTRTQAAKFAKAIKESSAQIRAGDTNTPHLADIVLAANTSVFKELTEQLRDYEKRNNLQQCGHHMQWLYDGTYTCEGGECSMCAAEYVESLRKQNSL